MARKTYRKRYYRRKGRWSANIKNINATQTIDRDVTGVVGDSVDLCLNPLQSDLTVSQQYTIKNIELSVYLENGSPYSLEGIEHYIMFVPQGMNLTTDYNYEHPEYIMTYYYQGNPVRDDEQLGYRLKLKTRMARRLQTGDRIIYFWKAIKEQSDSSIDPRTLTVNIRGLVRWWSKAN